MGNIFKALLAGVALKHSKTWKNLQLLTNSTVAITGVALPVLLHNHVISPEIINYIGGGLAMLAFGVYNVYTTVATTEKIGLPNKDTSGTGAAPPERENSLTGSHIPGH
jgi:hypothetical protein